MSDTLNIIERLTLVHQGLGKIEKRPVQGFKAFAIDDVYANIGPLFAKHGIVVTPSVKDTRYEAVEAKSGAKGFACFITVDYTFHAPDGSTVKMRAASEGIDYGDKSTNKALQQAFKYGLIQMFQISTGEVDPDAAVVEDVAELEPSAADIRLKAVKDAAWTHTDPGWDKEARIDEAKAIVDQAIAVLGTPKNKTEVAATIDYIDQMYGRTANG